MTPHIAVIGAGVVGVTSAYELAAAGHAVTVFDHGGTIAGEASFAPAGLDGPGWALGWSALAAGGARSTNQISLSWSQTTGVPASMSRCSITRSRPRPQ